MWQVQKIVEKKIMEIRVKESPGNVFGTKTRNGDSKPWF